MDDREKLTRLRDLLHISELAWQASAARHGALRKQDEEAAAEIAGLKQRRGSWDAAEAGMRFPKAEAQWQAWTDGRIAEVNLARARIRAKIEAGRPKLARSFGRRQVLEALTAETRGALAGKTEPDGG